MTAWLQPLHGDWLGAACELLTQQQSIVRVSVVAMQGSAPREAGAALLVAMHEQRGSIGGGQLEYQATCAARAMLQDDSQPPVQLRDYVLGPDLNQCCGGRVQLWLERLTGADRVALEGARAMLRDHAGLSIVTHVNGPRVTRQFALPEASAVPALRVQSRGDGSLTLIEGWQRRLPMLWLYGAGHVGQAIVKLLADLPLFDVTWVDSRLALLPDALPAHIRALPHAAPLESVTRAPAGATFLVLTHDHSLDYALCRAVLQRADFAWLGLIGSASKRARFRSRLARDGVAASLVERLDCPIGIGGIRSKLPAAIAVGVVAQLLAQSQTRAHSQPVTQTTDVAAGHCTGDCVDCGELRRHAL